MRSVKSNIKTKRLNILIISHEFSPYLGSECAIGWNIIRRIGNFHDVTVLYAETNQFGTKNYRNNYYKYTKENGLLIGVNPIAIKQPRITKCLVRFNKRISKDLTTVGFPPLFILGYKYWQYDAYKKAKILASRKTYDVVHQLTNIHFSEPGYLWKLGIPLVWGPTGGVNGLKLSFWRNLPVKTKILEFIRTLFNTYSYYSSRNVIETNSKAKIIYAFSDQDMKLFSKRAKYSVKPLTDTGAYMLVGKHASKSKEKRCIQGIWCGQIIPRKSIEIMLNALDNHVLKKYIKIKVIGSGPELEAMQKLSDYLKLENIEWLGSISQDKVFNHLENADFLIHTSIREATSAIIPEALSHGLPVICHDLSGMSLAINNKCGVKIPFIAPKISIQGFRSALIEFVENPEYLHKISIGAKQRSGEISWDAIAAKISNDYASIIKETHN